jgi:hypothetical protein
MTKELNKPTFIISSDILISLVNEGCYGRKTGEDSMNIKTIGEEAIGGSNSVVLKDVESRSISVVGLRKK